MTNEEFINLCIRANADLKAKYASYHSSILLDEIIQRVRKEGEKK